MWLGQARTPEGLRLYAIGDVHGCDDLLAEAHGKIAHDLASRPAADYRIIHVGDYGDRGPDTAAVLERLAGLTTADRRVICLRGNHDEMLLGFLSEPSEMGPTFIANGGEATLASYGVKLGRLAMLVRDNVNLARRLAEAMPPHHRAFLERLDLTARFGDYFFCHAGIRPGVPLDRQSPHDLTWIRDEFLLSGVDHGVIVVHGHTPAPEPEPEVLPNRINVDTGAVFSGRLTCLVLEVVDYSFL
jgi:serine/threonine protein phosphatase 1